MGDNTSLTRCIHRLIKRHGSVRAAASAHGVEPSYLYRLSTGEKVNPTADTLRKLKLKVVRYYSERKEADRG